MEEKATIEVTLKPEFVIGFISTTDGKCYCLVTPLDGGTGDVETEECECL